MSALKGCESDTEKSDWSLLYDDDEQRRMCRSLDIDFISRSNIDAEVSKASLHIDRSEPSLSEKKTGDLFGSRKVKNLLGGSRVKESVKNKILSVWTNTKNGVLLKMSQDFKSTPEIWMLGKCYLSDLISFRKDFACLPWISYRTGFPELGKSGPTSDVGWGCMVRCAQMCLAVTLNYHMKSKKVSGSLLDASILKLFADRPHWECPFSIHNLVSCGEMKGRHVGMWFGPASISDVLRSALLNAQEKYLQLPDFSIYVAQDSTVYIRDVLDEIKDKRSVMVIIPLRLGYDTLNECYTESFKEVFTWSCCVGVMGGRPRHSLYFVGYQGNDLIYLDPHFSQEVIDLSVDPCAETYHCSSPMKMHLSKMDPTCAVAFYCSDVSEFWQLVALVRQSEENLKKKQKQEKLLEVVSDNVTWKHQHSLLQFVDARHKDFIEADMYYGTLDLSSLAKDDKEVVSCSSYYNDEKAGICDNYDENNYVDADIGVVSEDTFENVKDYKNIKTYNVKNQHSDYGCTERGNTNDNSILTRKDVCINNDGDCVGHDFYFASKNDCRGDKLVQNYKLLANSSVQTQECGQLSQNVPSQSQCSLQCSYYNYQHYPNNAGFRRTRFNPVFNQHHYNISSITSPNAKEDLGGFSLLHETSESRSEVDSVYSFLPAPMAHRRYKLQNGLMASSHQNFSREEDGFVLL